MGGMGEDLIRPEWTCICGTASQGTPQGTHQGTRQGTHQRTSQGTDGPLLIYPFFTASGMCDHPAPSDDPHQCDMPPPRARSTSPPRVHISQRPPSPPRPPSTERPRPPGPPLPTLQQSPALICGLGSSYDATTLPTLFEWSHTRKRIIQDQARDRNQDAD